MVTILQNNPWGKDYGCRLILPAGKNAACIGLHLPHAGSHPLCQHHETDAAMFHSQDREQVALAIGTIPAEYAESPPLIE